MLNRFFHFFVYSNLFITCCTVIMVLHTSHFLLDELPDLNLVGFVVAGTLSSYSFHWFLTTYSAVSSHRVSWNQKNRKVLLAFFFISVPAAAWFFFKLLPYWPWLLIGVSATFLYSAPKISHPLFRLLRMVAIGKTIFLALVWTSVTTVYPLMIPTHEWRTDFTLFLLSRFFLIFAICILFDYRDRADDRLAGIRSLITYLPEKGIGVLFYTSLTLFAIATVLLYNHGYPVIDIILLLTPGMILCFVYGYAKRHYSDLFYYFFLDGLMMLSSLLMLVFRF